MGHRWESKVYCGEKEQKTAVPPLERAVETGPYIIQNSPKLTKTKWKVIDTDLLMSSYDVKDNIKYN